MFYKISCFICKVLCHILFRYRIVGKENVPNEKGFILASNHRTNFDPLFVAVHLKQTVCFMAKAELFQKAWMKWLMKRLNAFPVERGKGDTGALDWAMDVLRKGGVLGMFPEGHRSEDGKPLRPKSGAAMIAGQTHADVVPCAVCFDYPLKFRSQVTVRYGHPICFEDLGFTGEANSPREIKGASHLIMGEIIKLLEEGA